MNITKTEAGLIAFGTIACIAFSYLSCCYLYSIFERAAVARINPELNNAQIIAVLQLAREEHDNGREAVDIANIINRVLLPRTPPLSEEPSLNIMDLEQGPAVT